jgi:hypothetical protein
MKIQKELIEKYILLLLEYIHLVNSSEIIVHLENAPIVFQIGANALIHIYKLAFLITKNVESAGCYTQKGIYFYLEYIEQMNQTNSLHNLDNTDAILFVYDKTLTNIYAPQGFLPNIPSGGDSGEHEPRTKIEYLLSSATDVANSRTTITHQQHMFTNILSMNHPHTEDSDWKIMLENTGAFTKAILWMNNPKITYLQRLDLAHEHLQKWLGVAFESASSDYTDVGNLTLEILKYITTIQEKCIVDYTEYITFLETALKTYKKYIKRQGIQGVVKYSGGEAVGVRGNSGERSSSEFAESAAQAVRSKSAIFGRDKVSYENAIREKCMTIIVYFSGKTFREILDSDYGKTEGWKTIVDFVKWLFVAGTH